MITIDVAIPDASHVAGARRRAAALAASAGFGEARAGEVALVATELATNVVKHGGGGHLLIGADDTRLQLAALDLGRGMADVAECLADGYSTTGTPGNGLGALRRLCETFEVASWPQRGTVAIASLAREKSAARPAAPIGAIAIPKAGEEVSGDGFGTFGDAGGRTLFVVDGLGHGTEAAVAANAALEQFHKHRGAPPAAIVAAVHGALRHTRGAAVAVARIEWASATVSYAGVGNIAGVVCTPSGQLRRMVSHNGTAGHNARKIQAFEYPCGDGLLIMHSDGIGASWSLEAYPGLARAHPLLVAAVLYRDFGRSRDDATVLVARAGPA